MYRFSFHARPDPTPAPSETYWLFCPLIILIVGENNSYEHRQPNKGDSGESDGLQETQWRTQTQSATAEGFVRQDSYVGSHQENFSEPGSHSSFYHREDLGGRDTWTFEQSECKYTCTIIIVIIRLDLCLYYIRTMSEFLSMFLDMHTLCSPTFWNCFNVNGDL